MNKILDLHHITKQYENFQALKNISLSMNAGEILGLVGPNGSGKTTTLHLSCGIIKPSSGSIMVDSINLRVKSKDAKKLIGYVPDSTDIVSKLTAREFISFIHSLYEPNTNKTDELMEKLL